MMPKPDYQAEKTTVRRRAAGMLLVALLLLVPQPLSAAGRETGDLTDAVKAALIFNFAKFVEWPGEAKGRQHELVIGVAGDAELGEILERSAEGKSIRGMRIRVEPTVTGEGIAACHILYIGGALEQETSILLASLQDRPILTIGEDAEFMESGGIIRFKQAGSKIRFEIGHGTALDASLQISSKLLQLADAVQYERSRP